MDETVVACKVPATPPPDLQGNNQSTSSSHMLENTSAEPLLLRNEASPACFEDVQRLQKRFSPGKPQSKTNESVDGHSSKKSTSEDDYIIPVMQCGTSKCFEDIYDYAIVGPTRAPPIKQDKMHYHPEAIKMHILRKKKEIEEIYDLELKESCHASSQSRSNKMEQIYIDAAAIDDSDSPEEQATSEESKGHEMNSLSDSMIESDYWDSILVHSTTQDVNSSILPKARYKFDPLPELASLHLSDKQQESSGSEYEELVIYEEIGTNDKDGEYQDMDQARVEALGLSENIRQRGVGIVKGPQRKILKNSIKKRRIRHQAAKMEQNLNSHLHISNSTQKDLTSCETSIMGENDSLILEPELSVTTAESNISAGESVNISEDEEDLTSTIPREKIFQALDKLLEADNVKLVANARTQDQVEKKSAENIVLPPEIKEYQKAGILPVGAQELVTAEIKALVESAPEIPPPLPGVQRARAGVLTQSDVVIKKRNQLRKMNTFPMIAK